MFTLSRQQVRLFRLHAHHLDTWYSLQDALLTAYAATTQIQFPGRHFRQDIGRKAVRAK